MMVARRAAVEEQGGRQLERMPRRGWCNQTVVIVTAG